MIFPIKAASNSKEPKNITRSSQNQVKKLIPRKRVDKYSLSAGLGFDFDHSSECSYVTS